MEGMQGYEEGERAAYTVIHNCKDSNGLDYPPMLVKLWIKEDYENEETPSVPSQGASPARTPPIKLCLLASRLLNAREQTSDKLEVPQSQLVDRVRRSLKSPRLSQQDVIAEVLSRVRRRQYSASLSDQLRLRLQLHDLPDLNLSVQFDRDGPTHATPAFILAFQAACALFQSSLMSQAASEEAATKLRNQERDLNRADKKINNLEAELAEKSSQLYRLLHTGGTSLEDVAGNKRGRSFNSFSEASQQNHNGSGGSQNRDESMSPHKRLKAAEPTLAKPGRTVRKKVSAGFIESSSDDDDDGDGDGEEEGGNKGDYEKRRAGKPSDKSHPAALSDSGTEESVDSTSSAPKAAKSAPKVHRKR